MVGRVFDPVRIADDACAEGHLDTDPIYRVLLTIGQKAATGRLSIGDAAGPNHMFFMQGRPVGVQLADHLHPLGQLLLELGRLDGALFLRAQRLIAEGGRLPGQVYKELGVVDDHSLKDTLAIQARRKAEHFCRLGSRPFSFCKGLMYLTGFTSTPLDPHGVIYLAIRQQMGEQAREAWLESARGEQVRVVVPEGPVDPARPPEHGLPTAPANYGFGTPEERFLQRVVAGWESVVDLADTGTLPRDEMAVLLRYLEVIGRLQRRPIPPPPAPLLVPALGDGTDDGLAGLEPMSADEFAVLEVTAPEQPVIVVPPPSSLARTSSSPLLPPLAPTSPSPSPLLPPLAPPSPPAPSFPASPAPSSSRPPAPVGQIPPLRSPAPPRSPAVISGLTRRPADLDVAPLTESMADDVFSLSAAAAPSVSSPAPSSPAPSSPAPSSSAPSSPAPSSGSASSAADAASDVFGSSSSDVFAGPAPAGAPNPALHEPTPPLPVLPVEEPVPVVKKKKVKRSEPLPSEVSAVTVSETRREKTIVKALPSIVIDDD
jgi:hypothetical protein